jgi:hypothetical protein
MIIVNSSLLELQGKRLYGYSSKYLIDAYINAILALGVSFVIGVIDREHKHEVCGGAVGRSDHVDKKTPFWLFEMPECYDSLL